MPSPRTPERAAALSAFGRWLSAEMRRLSWSDEFVAERVGRTAATVNRWRHGEMEPGGENVVQLAVLFGITTDRLYRLLGFDLPAPRDQPATVPAPRDAVRVPVLDRVPIDPAHWDRAADRHLWYQPERPIDPDDRFVAVTAPADDLPPLLLPDDVLICDPREPRKRHRLAVVVAADGAPLPRLIAHVDGEWWLTTNASSGPLDEATWLGIVVEIRRRPPL